MPSILEKILSGRDSLYVLDLSWHLHRNYHTFKEMCVDIDGYQRPTGHLYGILSTIKMIKQVSPDAAIIITQDGVPEERNQMMAGDSEGYKEGRPDLEFNFYQDIPRIKAAACYVDHVYWAFNEDKECDDLMYALVKQAQKVESFKGKCYVYSGDNDLLQAIDDRCSVIRLKTKNGFDEITDEVVRTDEKFTKKFHGVDTKHIVNFRAICGDSSDKIKGVPRFPRDLAVKIALSVDDITTGYSYEAISATEKKWLERLDESYELVRRNYKLMKLSDDFEVKLSKPRVNREKLVEMLESFKLRSFLNYIE